MQAKPRLSICVAVWLMALGLLVRAETGILPAEHDREQKWTTAHLLAAGDLPFSFVYHGVPSGQFLSTWPHRQKTVLLDAHRIQHTLTWLDAATGLQVRCVAVEYDDFPVIEWTCYLKDVGKGPTALLEKIEAIDADITSGTSGNCHLRYCDGDGESHGQMQWAPHDTVLKAGQPMTFAPNAGRPTDGCFPYYNLDWGKAGVIAVLGWPGQWSTSLTANADGSVRVVGGQQLTHLQLQPGEQIRMPRATLLCWQRGDWIDTQNVWRSWMHKYNTPHPGGRDVAPIRAGGGFLYDKLGMGADLQNEHDQLDLLDRYKANGIQLNTWWIDIFGAGTFVKYSDAYMPDAQPIVTTWTTDRARFPHGLRAISDHARNLGENLLVWIEPEHVWPPNELWHEHNDWLLPSPEGEQERNWNNQGVPLGNRRLLDLGKKAADDWIINKLSHLIDQEGIEIYRQDFNITPHLFWKYHDEPDRQGMTENLYVQGYLRLLDEMQARHPKLLIDTCASGGRRDDLETLRRAVPLWKSDSWGPDVTIQNQTYGLAMWVPYFGTGTNTTDPYRYASALGSSLFTSWDVRDPAFKDPGIKKLEDEFWQTAPFFHEDYYPLGNYDGGPAAWMAWQFNRPAKGDGLVQAFRRDQANDSARTFILRGLDESANYEVRDLASNTIETISGHDLMTHGLEIKIDAKPGAYVAIYRKAARGSTGPSNNVR